MELRWSTSARLLLFTYRHQDAKVFWEGHLSEPFKIRNGVRQGAVLSPILFNFYTSELAKILDNGGQGCGARISGYYHGLFGYADDLGLLSNDRESMQEMLDKTASYAEKHNIIFSTNDIVEKSKTKSMIFGFGKQEDNPENLVLNGKKLPWVEKIKYLGTVITNKSVILETDIEIKRANFVDNVNSLRQQFHWAHPAVMSQINHIYNGSIYGANLYPIRCHSFKLLMNSFTRSSRIIWNVPHDTHRYIAENLAGGHLITSILSNMIGFYGRLVNSMKPPVRNLMKMSMGDMRTVTGINCKTLRDEGIHVGLINQNENFEDIDRKQFRQKYKFAPIPPEEEYRVGILNDLLGMRSRYSYFEDNQFLSDDIECMIRDVCSR